MTPTVVSGPSLASMRPRVFPAEDAVMKLCKNCRHLASMRPRVFPAEDTRSFSSFSVILPRFNEAAGIPRGRLRRASDGERRELVASMRPRVFPAEDSFAGEASHAYQQASMRPRVFPAEDIHTETGLAVSSTLQ